MTIVNHLLLDVPAAGAAAAPAWTPASLGSIAYWWKTDTGNVSTDVDGVHTWTDEIAAEDLLQATGSKKPQVSSSFMNGLDGIQFDGTDDRLATDAFAALSWPNTIFSIYHAQSISGTDMLHDGIASTKRHALYVTGNYRMFSGAVQASATAWDTSAHYAVATFANDSSADLRVDGSDILATSGTGTHNLTGLCVGSSDTDANHFAITVVEIGIVDGTVTGDDLTSLESYLATRSGV